MTTHQRFLLSRRPQGQPVREDFTLESGPVPEPGDGEFVVATRYISLDPAMRGWMREGRSYIPPVQLGEVMRALGVGEVIASRHEGFAVGDFVSGMLGVQTHARSNGEGMHKVDPSLAPLPAWLGVLGLTGMTAYFGLLKVGEPNEGDTVLVSGAAGATGSVVGQIAAIKGCRVIGIAGGEAKCRHLVEDLGFDAAIDYKAGDIAKRLRELAPKGVDVFFDNVGGQILDDALANLARGARVVICGAISQYNASSPPRGPSNYLSLLVNRARMEGFVVMDYAPQYKEAAMELGGWLGQGKLKYRETVAEGFETFPEALLRLFDGSKLGKLVLKVD